jgi:transposase
MPSRPRPWIVTGDLRRRVEPLLPSHPRRADGRGRPWRDDRKALCGILFVLHTGLPWEWLPQELGFGSGMTCWRRLRDCQLPYPPIVAARLDRQPSGCLN